MKQKTKIFWRNFIKRYDEYLIDSFEKQSAFNLIEFFDMGINTNYIKVEELVAIYLLRTKDIYIAIGEFIKEEEFEICAELKEIVDGTKNNLFDILDYIFEGNFAATKVHKDLIREQLGKQFEYHLLNGKIINPEKFDNDIVE